jgi:bifunctional ADP-heptose synthase (sugar kinase/adenylyltransferase)/phosphoglycolate phosphatase-like HAD superfamily hydrolase
MILTPRRLDVLLAEIPRARIGVIGDFCVDTYFIVDPDASEASLETGLPTRPVRELRSSLGGAGNVVANLRSIGVADLRAFAVIGSDSIGFELIRLLGGLNVDTAGVVVQPTNWQTHSYLKPIVNREEGNRYDFGIFNFLAPRSEQAILAAIEAALPTLDVVIINQQFRRGLHSMGFQAGLNDVLAKNRRVTAVVDCRNLGHVYPTGYRKLNDLEAARLSGVEHPSGQAISLREAADSALRLFQEWKEPVFVTRGRNGCLVVDSQGMHAIPGLHIVKETDSVGAGDSMVAGIAACLAIGASPAEAATFGNFVAGVTVQKLQQTGTASPAEVRAIGTSPDYVYNPELADDIRGAAYVPGTSIEIVDAPSAELEIRYAIFDHDGTISTLRQGWEQVMEPMMIRAILGPAYKTADRSVVDRVAERTRTFIDKTTGIQTLQQMHGLSLMVHEAGFVPEREILDAQGYKQIFNQSLMELVAARKRQIEQGELGVEDFTLKNAVSFLSELHEAGIRLYLASGTDEKDVILEAEALGYAPLFEGRIFGANQDMTHDPKRMVLDRILDEIGAANAGRIVTFGDGPVEIRETRKRGGLAVGLASDEVRRHGLKPEKRARVIRAGAHFVIPDYAQLGAILRLLNVGAKTHP